MSSVARIKRLMLKAETASSLGLSNIFRVIIYRIGVKSGINPVKRLKHNIPEGQFFTKYEGRIHSDQTANLLNKQIRIFGHKDLDISAAPPEWFTNFITGEKVSNPQMNWWEIPDFNSGAGDIKGIWDISRMDWAALMAAHMSCGRDEYSDKINLWLNDWLRHNPPYKGPNWKCGQETSLRVLHLMTAAAVAGQLDHPTDNLISLVEMHLKRVSATFSYALAQNNNHGTSESAALYAGGLLLEKNGLKTGKTYKNKGRKNLEKLVLKLFGRDGAFSQYSANYHRVVIDTLSMAEMFRQRLGDAEFCGAYYKRCAAAAEWLRIMIVNDDGDVPNFGANDGARLIPLAECDYRDFRPSVNLASALFRNETAFADHMASDAVLELLGINRPSAITDKPVSVVLDNGGTAVMRNNQAFAMVRYPRFGFRPGHADAMHLDFWLNGINILRDGGSYSYNNGEEWVSYFSGTKSHNTVMFDDRDQMIRLSRFLFGGWLKSYNVKWDMADVSGQFFSATYKDGYGAVHARKVTLYENRMLVEDDLSGSFDKGVLRWRLAPDVWNFNDGTATNGTVTLKIHSDGNQPGIRMTEGYESKYYFKLDKLPVLEAEFSEPSKIYTEIIWHK